MTIKLPRDGNYSPMQITPSTAALVSTYSASISSFLAITLNANTTYLEITAIDKGIFMKYASGASSSSYDEFIPANQTQAFIVPTGVAVISVIQQAASAAVSVIEK